MTAILLIFLMLSFSPKLLHAGRDADRVATHSPPPPPIEKTNDIFDLIWRHEEKGAIDKLESILKRSLNIKNLKDKDKLGGCSPMVNAVFATWANSNLSNYYTEIRKQRYDHVLLLLKYGADVKQKCSGRYGETPLHFAAEKGDINLIYFLVEKGADVHARDSLGQTPLFHVFTGNPEAANLLLHLGADVEAVSQNGTPLATAVYFTNPDIMEILLKHGADPIRKMPNYNRSTLDEAKERLKSDATNYELKKCISLMEKYRGLRAEFVKNHPRVKPKFSPSPMPPKQLLPEKTDSPLIIAVKEGDVARVRALLAKTKTPNIVSTSGDMPLHLSVKAGRIDITEVLLKSGANPDIRNADGEPPIVLARNNTDMIRLLLSYGAKVDQPGAYGQTALQTSQNPQAMSLLLKSGAHINRRSKFGYTALWNAVANKDAKAAEFLLKSGADINLQKDDGEAPLHRAVLDKNEMLVKLLLSKGANPNLQNAQGFTPYDIAVSQASTKLIAELSKSGGQFGDKEKVIREAIQNSNVPFVEKLLNQGVDPNLGLNKDNPHKSWPLLGQAVRVNPQNKDMLKLFISRGADVKFSDSNQNSLLHLVRNPEVLELLMQKGLDVDAVNDTRNTPLHINSAIAEVDCVRVLLKYTAFPNARNRSGLTPLEIALHGPLDERHGDGPPPDFKRETPKYLETIRLLLKSGADTVGLLQADFSKAPYYYPPYRKEDDPVSLGYKTFREQALQLIKASRFPVAERPKPQVVQASYEIPKEDKNLLFRMVSERFINKEDVLKWQTGKDPALVCNMPVLAAARILFQVNPDFAKTFPDFLNSLRLFSPPGEEINGVPTFPRREFQGYTLLHMAAYYNDIPLIKELIAAGANPDLQDHVGHTPLHYSVWGEAFDGENHLATVRTLTDAGTNVNIKNNNGETALFTQNGMTFSGSKPTHHLRIIQLLMKKGADIKAKNHEGKTLVDVLNIGKQVALQYKNQFPNQVQQYHDAIASLEAKGVRAGITYYNPASGKFEFKENLNQDKKDTPLIKSILENDENRVKELIHQGVDVQESGNGGWVPLSHAVQIGNFEIIKLLVKKGANIRPTHRRQSPISIALSGDRYELVTRLMELGAKPTSFDLYAMMSKTSLDQRGKETLQFLLNQGLNPNICNEQGESPLYEAAWRGSPEAVEILIRHGARVDYCLKDPRELARLENKKEILRLLDVQPKSGKSIYKILQDMWYKTKDCRLRK